MLKELFYYMFVSLTHLVTASGFMLILHPSKNGLLCHLLSSALYLLCSQGALVLSKDPAHLTTSPVLSGNSHLAPLLAQCLAFCLRLSLVYLSIFLQAVDSLKVRTSSCLESICLTRCWRRSSV